MKYYDERLHNMLRYMRPNGSATEMTWINKFIACYPEHYTLDDPQDPDDPFAIVIEVPHPDGSQSRTMFSAHTDTVHRQDGKQRIHFDRKTQTYYKDDDRPLGADDTAGCWLMLEMIDNKVPGVYVFHRGEECGGIGSTGIATNYPEFLSRFDRAVAFDRRGSTSVITHQGWGRCASDTFAEALAEALNDDGISMYMPDDTGIFTDTANYVDHIPECTNLSCGYDKEHTGNETLHLPTLFTLRDRCLQIHWDNLPTERDPHAIEIRSDRYTRYKPTDITYAPRILTQMTRAEMMDMAYEDPETFVALVREELFGEMPYEDGDDYYMDMVRFV